MPENPLEKLPEKQVAKQPFYNVMPDFTGATPPPTGEQLATPPSTIPIIKSASVAPKISSPVINSPVANSKSISTAIPAKKSRGTLFLVLGIVVLVLFGTAAGGFYLYKKLHVAKQAVVDNTNTTSETPANPDVTTPGEWLQRYFGSETCADIGMCGDKSDPDRDGLDNKAEFNANTDPNSNDSDKDGIADGDEVLIFHSDPLLSKTFRDGDYKDADFIKGGYDVQTNEPYTNERMLDIKNAIKQFGLHQPTLTTLGALSFQLYAFTDPSLPTLPADLDVSPQAKLDRDAQRQGTIKKIGAAILKYKADKKSYPPTDDFVVMADMIKTYNTVATNYNDPIDRDPYKYGYSAQDKNADFFLTYYSETQNQLIKYFAKDAIADQAKDHSKVNDEQRTADLESIQQALLIYSSTQIDPNSDKKFVFPPIDKLKSSLVPRYMTAIPTDPISKLEYQYQVGPDFDTFTLKATLDNPTAGTTGYMCNQLECKAY